MNSNHINYNIWILIILIVDSGVRKTNIFTPFIKNDFNDENKTTIESKFESNFMKLLKQL